MLLFWLARAPLLIQIQGNVKQQKQPLDKLGDTKGRVQDSPEPDAGKGEKLSDAV